MNAKRGLKYGCWGLLWLAAALAPTAFGEDADEILAAAQAARSAGRLAESERLSLQALEIRPGWGLADYNLALTRMLAGDAATARKTFLKAYREDSSLAPSLLFAGVASHNLGEYEAAAGYFRRYLTLRPNDPQVHFYFGGTDLALGDYSGAAAEYLAQASITPQRAEVYYNLAECFLTLAGKTLTALPETGEGLRFRGLAIAVDNDGTEALPEASLRLARQQLRIGNAKRAVELLAGVAGVGAGECPALENQGDALLAAGDPAGALDRYQKAKSIWPRCFEQPPVENLGLEPAEFAKRVEGLTATANGANRKAVADFELPRLHGWDAESPARPCKAAAGTLARASCFASRGALGPATAALAADHALRTDARSVYWIFEIYGEMARSAATRLAKLSPDSYLLAEMSAEAFELDGLPEQAEAQYRKAVAGAGADPAPAIAYGRFQCKLARFPDAISTLEDALRRDPNNVEAHSLAAEAYLRTDHLTDAVPHLRAVLKARPNDTGTRIDLARSLARSGKPEEAVTLLEATPSDPDGRAHYTLARLYRQMGRTEDSKRAMAFFERRRERARGSPKQDESTEENR